MMILPPFFPALRMNMKRYEARAIFSDFRAKCSKKLHTVQETLLVLGTQKQV